MRKLIIISLLALSVLIAAIPPSEPTPESAEYQCQMNAAEVSDMPIEDIIEMCQD